jgi:hypothetical protein
MADTNLYQELKDELQQVKDFLTTNVPIIKPAIQSLRALIPQITDLLNGLINLMGQIKTAIQNLNVSNIPGLAQVSSFTQLITNVLTTVENLLPSEKSAIDQVLGIAQVVGGLPSIDAVKQDIISLLDTITGQLQSLTA